MPKKKSRSTRKSNNLHSVKKGYAGFTPFQLIVVFSVFIVFAVFVMMYY